MDFSFLYPEFKTPKEYKSSLLHTFKCSFSSSSTSDSDSSSFSSSPEEAWSRLSSSEPDYYSLSSLSSLFYAFLSFLYVLRFT